MPSAATTEIVVVGSPSTEEFSTMLISFLCQVMLVLDSFHHSLNTNDQAGPITPILHFLMN
jgi:hypothetical protein